MEQVEVELFTRAGNNAITRMPGRRFPGIVVQGDSYSVRWSNASAALALARAGDSRRGDADACSLTRLLNDELRRYETVLDAYQLDRPYHLPDRP